LYIINKAFKGISVTNIQVYNFKISLIWFEPILNLISDSLPQTEYDFLGRHLSYVAKFHDIYSSYPEKGGIKFPWPGIEPKSQHFWNYYSEGKLLKSKQVSKGKALKNAIFSAGKQAHKALLPFREKEDDLKVYIPSLPGQKPILLESFLYPYGIATVVSATIKVTEENSLSLQKTIEVAMEIRHGNNLRIFSHGNSENSTSMDTLVSNYMDITRQKLIGDLLPNNKRSVNPMTVVTFVKANCVNPELPIKEFGDIHRSLEALSGWSHTWQYDKLPSLEKAIVDTKSRSPLSHILYGSNKGRVVWFPAHFISCSSPRRSLSCYHRNLTLSSLQVESLCGLISMTARYLREGIDLEKEHDACARRAAGLLGRLYAGKQTYRSGSIRKFIEQNDYIEDTNLVRNHFNLDALC
jgi:hypothetical protein